MKSSAASPLRASALAIVSMLSTHLQFAKIASTGFADADCAANWTDPDLAIGNVGMQHGEVLHEVSLELCVLKKSRYQP
jgi:hypothetical protein